MPDSNIASDRMVVVAFGEKRLTRAGPFIFCLVGSVLRPKEKGTGRIACQGKFVYLK